MSTQPTTIRALDDPVVLARAAAMIRRALARRRARLAAEAAAPTGGVIDVSQYSLAQLATKSGDALDAAIQRVTEAAEDAPEKAVCAFNSAI